MTSICVIKTPIAVTIKTVLQASQQINPNGNEGSYGYFFKNSFLSLKILLNKLSTVSKVYKGEGTSF